MKTFDKAVPFDPGFSPLSFSFNNNICVAFQDYSKLKSNHQKKFWLIKFEPTIIEFINKSTAFYLGCILWGGFIHFRFKDESKEIEGNNTSNLSEQERKELDCASEIKAISEYIKNFDRDCKYFLKRPAKISSFIKEIIEGYIEFVQINNNFLEVKKTGDVKIPAVISHFKDLSNEQLDELCQKIYEIINSGKIENLLELGFYKINE